MNRLAWIALVFGFVVGCGGATTDPGISDAERLDPRNLYPLDDGHVWSYDVDTGTEHRTLAITRVISHIGNRFELSSGGDAVLYEMRPEGIWRPGSETWLLEAPVREGREWDSPHGMTAKVSSTDADIETPAGNFHDCVRIDETGGEEGREVTTVYCSGIGPVFLESRMQLTLSEEPVRVVARLLGYSFDPSVDLD
jgi:hypothetical protein